MNPGGEVWQRKPTVEQMGRIHIRKRNSVWTVTRYHHGRAYIIHAAKTFDGIREYMDMRRRDW